jgi:uncharacterized protein YdaU (DUF1376 family)
MSNDDQVIGLAMLPWFHRDFLASTQGWTASETGVYFLLLCAQWEMGPLPNDRARLALIARSTPKEFKTIWEKKVSRKFMTTPRGLVNSRLEEHRCEALRRRDQHRRGALQTNEKRWGTSLSDTHCESLSDTLSESPSVSPPSPSPSPSLKRLTKGGSEFLRSDGGLLPDEARIKA